MTANAVLRDLERRIGGLESVVVAFSGGVDSSVVAAVAARTLGPRALAVTSVSPALGSGELAGARRVAAAIGIAHETVRTHELERAGYQANGPDRCFHCKSELYEVLGSLARARGYAAIASGTNADDLGDWRPGLRAAERHGVLHPLAEMGIDKTTVRELAAMLGVPSASKPASPCLASRIPYGTRVSAAALEQIDRAETAVRALGFDELRVRHLGDAARLELPERSLTRALRPRTADALTQAIESAGYRRVLISSKPLRSGSLNVGIAR